MATAVPWFDPENGASPRASRTWSGWDVAEPFRVNSSEKELALTASGLPSIGAAHPRPEFAGAVCQGLDWEYICGEDGPSGKVGWSLVTARYTTPQAGQFDLVYESGQAYSEPVFSDGSAPARFDIAGVAIPETQIEAYRAELLIHRYAADPAVALSALQFVNRTNTNAFQVPPIFGVGAPVSIAAGELLMRSPQVSLARPGLLRVTLRFGFGVAGWHRLAYRREAEDGTPSGPVITADLYQSAAFPVASWWSVA